MIWLNRVFNRRIQSMNELNEIVDSVENSKKTMGALINEVKTAYSLTETLKDDLNEVLGSRNYIVHRFFKEHIQKFYTDLGKKEMLKAFCDFIDDSKNVDTQLNYYYTHYIERMGATDERIEAIIQEMIDEEKLREQIEKQQ